jgi:DNA recombination protein RmuC
VTTDQFMMAALGGIVLMLLGLLVVLLLRGRSGKSGALQLPPGAEALAPAFAELRAQLGDLRSQLEEVRRSEAAAEARRGQEDAAFGAIARLEQSLTKLDALPTLQQSMQEQVSSALRDLASLRELQAATKARWTREDDAFASLQRLSAILGGSSSSGAAGERIVREVLDSLPPQWRITQHVVAGKPVEFAVKLPDGLILPIDSKVVGQAELDELRGEQDVERRRRKEKAVCDQVLQKAGEIRKYIDERSVGFGIIAVPDPAYDVSGPILSKAYQEQHAIVVPYRLLAPFVLMVYEQHRHAGAYDGARISRLLLDAQSHIERASQLLNGQLSSALTQLANGRDRLSGELAAASLAMDQARVSGEERASA